jgi:hypothetical protein
MTIVRHKELNKDLSKWKKSSTMEAHTLWNLGQKGRPYTSSPICYLLLNQLKWIAEDRPEWISSTASTVEQPPSWAMGMGVGWLIVKKTVVTQRELGEWVYLNTHVHDFWQIVK